MASYTYTKAYECVSHDEDKLLKKLCKNLKVDKKWTDVLIKVFKAADFDKVLKKLKEKEDGGKKICPPVSEVFSWTRYCNPEAVKMVIIGQDPKGDENDTGIAFTFDQDVDPCKSITMLHQLVFTGKLPPDHGKIWCEQGVLMLNNVATRGKKGTAEQSHAKIGWEEFTQELIKWLCKSNNKGLVFIQFGKKARANLKDVMEKYTVCKANKFIDGYENDRDPDEDKYKSKDGKKQTRRPPVSMVCCHPAYSKFSQQTKDDNNPLMLANEQLNEFKLTPIKWTQQTIPAHDVKGVTDKLAATKLGKKKAAPKKSAVKKR